MIIHAWHTIWSYTLLECRGSPPSGCGTRLSPPGEVAKGHEMQLRGALGTSRWPYQQLRCPAPPETDMTTCAHGSMLNTHACKQHSHGTGHNAVDSPVTEYIGIPFGSPMNALLGRRHASSGRPRHLPKCVLALKAVLNMRFKSDIHAKLRSPRSFGHSPPPPPPF